MRAEFISIRIYSSILIDQLKQPEHLKVFIFISLSSSVPDIFPCGCWLLLLPRWQRDGQHRAGHVQWLAEDSGGGHAAPPPRDGLPHHHKPSCTIFWTASEYSVRLDHNWALIGSNIFNKFQYDSFNFLNSSLLALFMHYNPSPLIIFDFWF